MRPSSDREAPAMSHVLDRIQRHVASNQTSPITLKAAESRAVLAALSRLEHAVKEAVAGAIHRVETEVAASLRLFESAAERHDSSAAELPRFAAPAPASWLRSGDAALLSGVSARQLRRQASRWYALQKRGEGVEIRVARTGPGSGAHWQFREVDCVRVGVNSGVPAALDRSATSTSRHEITTAKHSRLRHGGAGVDDRGRAVAIAMEMAAELYRAHTRGQREHAFGDAVPRQRTERHGVGHSGEALRAPGTVGPAGGAPAVSAAHRAGKRQRTSGCAGTGRRGSGTIRYGARRQRDARRRGRAGGDTPGPARHRIAVRCEGVKGGWGPRMASIPSFLCPGRFENCAFIARVHTPYGRFRAGLRPA